jgi:GTPase
VDDAAALAARVLTGDTRAVAKALSLVEEGGTGVEALLRQIGAERRASRLIGFTGGFGAGKSTLVEAVGACLLERGERVAVLAVDPSSPFTGGALLGDRIRMNRLASGGGFVRSMATRGALGGLSGAAGEAIAVLEAAGFDWVLVETVGAGQDEIDIAAEVDTVVVLLPPGAGDDVQTAKAGLLEAADLLVVNKADQPGADGVVAALEGMVALGTACDWVPSVLRTVARTGEGVEALLEAIESHQRHLDGSGRRDALRRTRRRRRVEALVAELAVDLVRANDPAAWTSTLDAVAAGELDAYTAARRLLAAIGRRA